LERLRLEASGEFHHHTNGEYHDEQADRKHDQKLEWSRIRIVTRLEAAGAQPPACPASEQVDHHQNRDDGDADRCYDQDDYKLVLR
jgi:hypothetical protein